MEYAHVDAGVCSRKESTKLDTRKLATRVIAGLTGVLCVAAAVESLAGPVKTSKYPWINTWAVEYYDANTTALQKDAAKFDIHLSPHNISGIKSLAPYSIAIKYHIWREQYANEEPGAVNDRRKMDIWCAANGVDKENFYCHYGRDLTIKSYNISTGKDEYVAIPGWDKANDSNGDGARDWASDYGISSGAGAGYLVDSTKTWGSNQWANATLVDKDGRTYRVTGNSSNRINVESGTPASGRYGLSAAGSPNVFASARTRAEARAKTFIWENYAYAMNMANPDYQAFRGYDAKKLIVDGDTTWDPEASSLWDGFMIDNTQPEFPWPELIDGTEIVTEYPDKSRWADDQVALFKVVRSAMGSSKFIWGNTGAYDYMSIADAGGGQHQEQYLAITNEHGPVQWDYWKQQSDKGIYSLVLPSWDCWPDQSERERMHYLAFHYMGQQPYIYLGFRGFGYLDVYQWAWTPYDWLTAAETDVGTAVDPMYQLAASGTDPTGQAYKIFKRRYTKALIVCRPRYSWDMQNSGDNTAVSFNLPSYNTDSGQSNLYKPLKSDGTYGTAVSKVSLRMPESYILFPADSAVTPPPTEPTTLQVSGVTVSNVTTSSATLSWSANKTVSATVEYGATTAYGSSVNSANTSTNFTQSLSGLQAGTTYHYRVKCVDTDGNQAITPDATFITTTSVDQPQGAFIKEWLLLGPFDEPNPLVGTTDFIGETSVKPSRGKVAGGKGWTGYQSPTDKIDFYQAVSQEPYKAVYAHVYINSPAAKAYRLLLGSDDGVKVWVNRVQVYQNMISRCAAPDEDDVSINLVKGWNSLLIKVTQEEGGWGLYARIIDSTRADVNGLVYQLDEPAPADTTAPVITAIKTKAVSQTSVEISWTTGEAANSTVSYGPTTTYGKTASNSTMVTSHTVTLDSLTPGQVYNYKVRSTDAGGNTASSANMQFTMPGPAPFIRQWLVVGSYSNTSRSGFNKDFVGELTASPTTGTISSGRTWTYHQSTTDLINFNSIYTPNDYAVAYAHVYVYSPSIKLCQLWTGSDDGLKVWVNSKLIVSKMVNRSAVRDTDKLPITLKAGWNKILIKVDELTAGWGFYARICDSTGKQVPWLKYQVNKPAGL